MYKLKTVQLQDIATFINGFAFKPSEWSNKGLPIIRIQNLTNSSDTMNKYEGEYKPQFLVNDGDILISWSASLGVYEWTGGTALLNQHIFKVVFDKIQIDKRYFYHAIAHLLVEMQGETHGSTMKHITKDRFDKLEIPLPPLEEQKKVAATLDAVSDLIRMRKRQLEELNLLVKVRFVEMFGGISEENFVSLTATGVIGTGSTPSMKILEYYENDDIPFFKPSDLADEVTTLFEAEYKIDKRAESASRMFDKNTVLVTCIGTIGKIGIAKTRATCNQQINYILPNSTTNSVFLAYSISSRKSHLKAMANAPVVPIINKSEFSKFRIPFADIETQNSFASFVEQVDVSKLLVRKDLKELEFLMNALMQIHFR